MKPFSQIFNESVEDQIDAQKGEHHTSAGDDHRFWGNRGAGILLTCGATNRSLWMLRSPFVNEPGTWGLIGGKIDDGEEPETALVREVEEETDWSGEIRDMRLVDTFRSGTFTFFNYRGDVADEFEPTLNWESSKSLWLPAGEFPSPLHFGVERIRNKFT
jgi:8-oxo-dGTP pyrophosphatase MutT (NUDIX family)